MTQKQRVLEALLAAPGKQMLTGQLHKLPYITNFRARISDLRKDGHIIECKLLKGSKSSVFTYMGLFPHISMKQTEKEMFGGFSEWRVITDSIECLEIGGEL